jgi:hypothetical protein
MYLERTVPPDLSQGWAVVFVLFFVKEDPSV